MFHTVKKIRIAPGATKLLFVTVFAICFWGPIAGAQDTESTAPKDAVSESEAITLEELFEATELDRAAIVLFAKQADNADGVMREVYEVRLDGASMSFFASIIKVAKRLAANQKSSQDISPFIEQVTADLNRIPDTAFEIMQRMGVRAVFSTDELSVVDLVATDQKFFAAIRDFDAVLQILVNYLSACDSLSIDVGDNRDKIVDRIVDAAANRSAFLDISVRREQNLRATAAILSSNTEVTDRLNAASARVQLTAQSMNTLIGILGALGQDARHYRQQVITTTGAITTDVLKVDVVSDLFNQWFQSVKQHFISDGPRLLFRLLLMTLIIFLFVRLSRVVEKLIKKALESSHVTLSHLLQRMIVMSGRNFTVLLGILIALSQVGISLGPLLAGLGIAGFIVGFAMQDALSNFASGMLILFYRPFDVGDTVEAGGESGKVHSMSLVNTTILTFDNQRLIIPNNKIWSSVIKNFTAQRVRRVDLTFGIAYHDDVDKAEEIFREIVDAHELTLDTPLPLIHLNELGESSVNFIVRPWVKTDDYWQVYWDITKEVKKRLEDAGITIPFPQREIHTGQPGPDLSGGK